MSRFSGKYNIFKHVSTCQTRSYDFWIMNAMCMFVYLFVIFFHLLLSSLQASIAMWAILISKSWWWLLKPKRSMSTLLHTVGFWSIISINTKWSIFVIEYIYIVRIVQTQSQYIHIYLYLCVYVCMHVYISVCMCMCVCVCVYICVCVCVCVRVYHRKLLRSHISYCLTHVPGSKQKEIWKRYINVTGSALPLCVPRRFLMRLSYTRDTLA